MAQSSIRDIHQGILSSGRLDVAEHMFCGQFFAPYHRNSDKNHNDFPRLSTKMHNKNESYSRCVSYMEGKLPNTSFGLHFVIKRGKYK